MLLRNHVGKILWESKVQSLFQKKIFGRNLMLIGFNNHGWHFRSDHEVTPGPQMLMSFI